MTKRSLQFFALFLLVTGIAIGSIGCDALLNITQNTGQTVTTGTGPTPVVSASPTPDPAIQTVVVTPLEKCSPCPVGVPVWFGATPKYAGGVDVPPAVHGPDCAWEVLSGDVKLSDYPGNQFNKYVTSKSAGTFKIKATVKGVIGTFEGEAR